MSELVTYFSCSGVTKKVAQVVAESLKADIYEIEPKELYTSEDLNWNDSNSRSTVEMNDPTSRPEIRNNIDIEKYDTIFVGFPIWWYIAPKIINTFLESYNFDGKVVIPFATSGGSGFDKVQESLNREYSINIKQGKLLSTRTTTKDILDWVESLGL